jgi:hypothetical protein
MTQANNVTSLVLIALAVIVGGSLLAAGMTPVDASAPVKKKKAPPGGCDEDFLNPATHNPKCGTSYI